MIPLTETTQPPVLKNSTVGRAALVYAAILTVLAITQLYSFDDFLQLVRGFALPGGRPLAYGLATVIVIAEVLAIPYLLRMRLDPVMRWLSLAMGWLAAGLWLGLTLWLLLSASTVTNVGLFGSVLALAPGWPALLVGLVLVGLASWTGWGMWPTRGK